MNLQNGNCLDLMKDLPDKSIDLFICDLPYGETNCKWDSKIDMDEFWSEFKRLRKSKRTACIHFCSTKFGYTLIKSWEKGFKMDMVWKKRNKTGGLQSRHRPMRNHEMVYFFYEQAPKYNRDKYHKRIVATKPNVKEEVVEDMDEFGWSIGKLPKENRGKEGFKPVLPVSVVEEDEPKSMFESTKVFIGKRHHQTEKPQDILEFFLKYWTDENDTVLDPTMGSGSTGVACKKLNRKFIGFELDEKIFKVAKNRCECGS
tara:strand:+ start:307 stop:1080 length:774 start_codon:yes stop_codon:yes gene_type:complete